MNVTPEMSPFSFYTLFALQGLWGLFLIVLTWSMRRVLTDIKENTKATGDVANSVNQINLLLTGNYITKSEFDRLEARLRDAEQKATRLETRMETVRSHGRGDE